MGRSLARTSCSPVAIRRDRPAQSLPCPSDPQRAVDTLRKRGTELQRQRPMAEDGEALRDARPEEVIEAEELWQRMPALCPDQHQSLLRLRRHRAYTKARCAASCTNWHACSPFIRHRACNSRLISAAPACGLESKKQLAPAICVAWRFARMFPASPRRIPPACPRSALLTTPCVVPRRPCSPRPGSVYSRVRVRTTPRCLNEGCSLVGFTGAYTALFFPCKRGRPSEQCCAICPRRAAACCAMKH